VNNLRSYLEEIVAAPGLENRSYDRRDSLRWPRDTLYPVKFAPASLTGGDRPIDRYSSLADSKPRSFVALFSRATTPDTAKEQKIRKLSLQCLPLDRLCGLVVRVPVQIQRSRVQCSALLDFLRNFLLLWFFKGRNRDSSVGIATRLRAGWPRNLSFIIGGARTFICSIRIRLAMGPTQPLIQLVPWDEAEHSLPPSAEVRNKWSYTSTPSYMFMVCCLIN
jgi:hypothetical protein